MWAPRCQFPTDSEGRFPGGVLSPLCSHIHIPNGIMSEGPTMVRLPWGECHPKAAPQPLPTRYQLLRPDFLLQLCSRVHTFLCVPGLYGLYWETEPVEHLNPRVPLHFPLFSPVPHPCSEKNSLLFLFGFSAFIPSALFLDEVQQKSSSFCPL